MRKLRPHQNVLTIGFWKNCKLKTDVSQLRIWRVLLVNLPNSKDIDYILVITNSTNQLDVTTLQEAKQWSKCLTLKMQETKPNRRESPIHKYSGDSLNDRKTSKHKPLVTTGIEDLHSVNQLDLRDVDRTCYSTTAEPTASPEHTEGQPRLANHLLGPLWLMACVCIVHDLSVVFMFLKGCPK